MTFDPLTSGRARGRRVGAGAAVMAAGALFGAGYLAGQATAAGASSARCWTMPAPKGGAAAQVCVTAPMTADTPGPPPAAAPARLVRLDAAIVAHLTARGMRPDATPLTVGSARWFAWRLREWPAIARSSVWALSEPDRVVLGRFVVALSHSWHDDQARWQVVEVLTHERLHTFTRDEGLVTAVARDEARAYLRRTYGRHYRDPNYFYPTRTARVRLCSAQAAGAPWRSPAAVLVRRAWLLDPAAHAAGMAACRVVVPRARLATPPDAAPPTEVTR